MNDNKASSMEIVWLVRDARGLNGNEKSLLYTIASRGVLKTSRTTTEADTGLGKDTLYRTRKSLIEKGLITEHKGFFNPVSGKRDQTHIMINEQVLASFNDSQIENNDSHYENNDSQIEKEDSQIKDIKVTEKITEKITVKVTEKKTEEYNPAEAGAVLENTSANSNIPNNDNEEIISALSTTPLLSLTNNVPRRHDSQYENGEPRRMTREEIALAKGYKLST